LHKRSKAIHLFHSQVNLIIVFETEKVLITRGVIIIIPRIMKWPLLIVVLLLLLLGGQKMSVVRWRIRNYIKNVFRPTLLTI
jgi:hypothetical protein